MFSLFSALTGDARLAFLRVSNFFLPVVKPARLHFARTALALRLDRERGALSERPAGRARASYWFDNLA